MFSGAKNFGVSDGVLGAWAGAAKFGVGDTAAEAMLPEPTIDGAVGDDVVGAQTFYVAGHEPRLHLDEPRSLGSSVLTAMIGDAEKAAAVPQAFAQLHAPSPLGVQERPEPTVEDGAMQMMASGSGKAASVVPGTTHQFFDGHITVTELRPIAGKTSSLLVSGAEDVMSVADRFAFGRADESSLNEGVARQLAPHFSNKRDVLVVLGTANSANPEKSAAYILVARSGDEWKVSLTSREKGGSVTYRQIRMIENEAVETSPRGENKLYSGKLKTFLSQLRAMAESEEGAAQTIKHDGTTGAAGEANGPSFEEVVGRFRAMFDLGLERGVLLAPGQAIVNRVARDLLSGDKRTADIVNEAVRRRAGLSKILGDAAYASINGAIEELSEAVSLLERSPNALVSQHGSDDGSIYSASDGSRNTVLNGLAARERLEGLNAIFANETAALSMSDETAAVCRRLLSGRLPEFDRRLRGVLPALWPLGPERSEMATALPSEIVDKHWWISEPVSEPEELFAKPTPDETAEFGQLMAWVRAHVTSDGRLRLTREELARLQDMPGGDNLIASISGRLNLDDVLPTWDEVRAEVRKIWAERNASARDSNVSGFVELPPINNGKASLVVSWGNADISKHVRGWAELDVLDWNLVHRLAQYFIGKEQVVAQAGGAFSGLGERARHPGVSIRRDGQDLVVSFDHEYDGKGSTSSDQIRLPNHGSITVNGGTEISDRMHGAVNFLIALRAMIEAGERTREAKVDKDVVAPRYDLPTVLPIKGVFAPQIHKEPDGSTIIELPPISNGASLVVGWNGNPNIFPDLHQYGFGSAGFSVLDVDLARQLAPAFVGKRDVFAKIGVVPRGSRGLSQSVDVWREGDDMWHAEKYMDDTEGAERDTVFFKEGGIPFFNDDPLDSIELSQDRKVEIGGVVRFLEALSAMVRVRENTWAPKSRVEEGALIGGQVATYDEKASEYFDLLGREIAALGFATPDNVESLARHIVHEHDTGIRYEKMAEFFAQKGLDSKASLQIEDEVEFPVGHMAEMPGSLVGQVAVEGKTFYVRQGDTVFEVAVYIAGVVSFGSQEEGVGNIDLYEHWVTVKKAE